MNALDVLACATAVACCLGSAAGRADELPLTKEELIVLSTDTAWKLRCDDGWSGELITRGDGSAEATWRCHAGVYHRAEGTWTIVDSPDGVVRCLAWAQLAPACSRFFKEEDRYVARTTGGKARTCWFTPAGASR